MPCSACPSGPIRRRLATVVTPPGAALGPRRPAGGYDVVVIANMSPPAAEYVARRIHQLLIASD